MLDGSSSPFVCNHPQCSTLTASIASLYSLTDTLSAFVSRKQTRSGSYTCRPRQNVAPLETSSRCDSLCYLSTTLHLFLTHSIAKRRQCQTLCFSMLFFRNIQSFDTSYTSDRFHTIGSSVMNHTLRSARRASLIVCKERLAIYIELELKSTKVKEESTGIWGYHQ